MLGLLLIIASLLGCCLFIRERFGMQAEETPILAVSAAVLALYVFALANLLAAGAYFLLGAGLVMLAWVLVKNRKTPRELVKAAFSPGMVAFLVGIPALYLLFHGNSFSFWDDFSHWGFAAKAMTVTNALPGKGTILTYPAYPPGTALFEYFLCKIIGWKEGVVEVAHLMIAWAAAVAFTKKLKWKQLPVFILVMAVVCVGYIHFNNTIHHMQVDGLLGIVIGSAFAMYYEGRDQGLSGIYKAIPVLAMATLVKDTGLFLSVLMALVMLADQLFLRVKPADAPQKQGFFRRHVGVPAVFALLGACAAVYASWKVYLNAVGMPANINAVHDIFAVQYHAAANPGVAPAFLNALVNTNVGTSVGFAAHFSTALFFLLLIALATGILLLVARDTAVRKRIAVLMGSLLGAFAIYSAGLFFTYAYLFSAHEASYIASYPRYMGTIFQILFLCLLVIIVQWAGDPQTERWQRKRLLILPGALLVLYLAVTPPGRYGAFWRVGDLPEARKAAVSVLSKLNGVAKPSDRVYLIFENEDAGDFFTFKYDLFPRGTNERNWNIGQPADATDIWMEQMTPEQWAGELADYQYVYVGHVTGAFKAQYGGLFTPGGVSDNSLYAVTAAPGGSILLKPVN